VLNREGACCKCLAGNRRIVSSSRGRGLLKVLNRVGACCKCLTGKGFVVSV